MLIDNKKKPKINEGVLDIFLKKNKYNINDKMLIVNGKNLDM